MRALSSLAAVVALVVPQLLAQSEASAQLPSPPPARPAPPTGSDTKTPPGVADAPGEDAPGEGAPDLDAAGEVADDAGRASEKRAGRDDLAPVPLEPAAPPPGRGASPKRRLPDYGGRGEPTSAGDVAIWVPRVAFLPLYLTSEFVLRRPLGLLVTTAERERWIEEIADFFTFGPSNNIGVVPTAVIDFGFRGSVGVYAFWDEFLAKKNALRLHAATGGTDWLRLTVSDRVTLSERDELRARFEFWRRPDGAFYGIGPNSLAPNRSRFAVDRVDLSTTLSLRAKRRFSGETTTGVRLVSFRPGTCCEDPSLDEQIARGVFPGPPPGYPNGYSLLRESAWLAYDTRPERGIEPTSGTGLRVQTSGQFNLDVGSLGEGPGFTFARAALAATGFWEVGHDRVFSLTLYGEDTVGGDVPFTEMVDVGGLSLLRGLREGRTRGESGAAALLEYRYPIWAVLDGSAQLGLGNTFSRHYEDFSPGRLRLSFAVGFRTSTARDHSFNLLLGSGTDTFDDGAGLHEVRFLFGTIHGF